MSEYEKQKNCKHLRSNYNNEGTFCDDCGMKLSMYAIMRILDLEEKLSQANEKLKKAVNLIQKYVNSGEGIYFYDSEAMCEFLKEQGADFSVKERHFSEQKMAKRLNRKREE